MLLLVPCMGISQTMFDTEMEAIAQSVRQVAGQELEGHNIAIGDILNSEGNKTALGKRIADELSYALSTKGANFKVVNRKHFQALMDEVDRQALLDDRTVLRLGRMVGISVVVYGVLHQESNNYRVLLKYALLEAQTTHALCRGTLTRLPSVDAMYQPKFVKEPSIPAEETMKPRTEAKPRSSELSVFRSGHLQLVFKGCEQEFGVLKCEYEVLSFNRNESFMIFAENSFLEQGQRRVRPHSVVMGMERSSVHLSTVLEANKVSRFFLYFNDFIAGRPATLNLHARTPTHFNFDFTSSLIK